MKGSRTSFRISDVERKHFHEDDRLSRGEFPLRWKEKS